jgi:hypothetical protein
VPSTIAEVQGYALAQLDSLAHKLEDTRRVSTLADVMQHAQRITQEWLAILARTFQLQDGIAVLELDRVLDAAPDELDAHRDGLREARDDRLELIEQATRRLLERIDEALIRANSKVLRHPSASPAVVEAEEKVARRLEDFHELLGLGAARREIEVRRWGAAAAEARARALESGAGTVAQALRRGGVAAEAATQNARELRGRIGERVARARDKAEAEQGEP